MHFLTKQNRKNRRILIIHTSSQRTLRKHPLKRPRNQKNAWKPHIKSKTLPHNRKIIHRKYECLKHIQRNPKINRMVNRRWIQPTHYRPNRRKPTAITNLKKSSSKAKNGNSRRTNQEIPKKIRKKQRFSTRLHQTTVSIPRVPNPVRFS